MHGTSLALEFSLYGQDIDEEDMLSCCSAAAQYVHDVVQSQGDGLIPFGLQLYWAHRTVAFAVSHSPRMTYDTLANIIVGIEIFQLTFGYFETHFKIIDNTRGEIGAGDARSAQPSTSSKLDNSTSHTLPVENIVPASEQSKPLGRPPIMPFIWHVPEDPTLELNFTAYGRELAQVDVVSCYVAAANFIKLMIETHGDVPIDPRYFLHWTHGTASLTFEPEPRMLFGTLADVLTALSLFQVEYGFTEVAFHILEEDRPPLGTGTVAWRHRRPGAQPEPVTSLLTLPQGTNTSSSAAVGIPHDPTAIRVPNSNIILTFSKYGRALPEIDFLLAIVQITLRIITEIQKPGGDHSIGEDLDWKWDRVMLFVSPTEEMTWGTLGTVINGITSFGVQYEWVSFDYLVEQEDGDGKLSVAGSGFASRIPP